MKTKIDLRKIDYELLYNKTNEVLSLLTDKDWTDIRSNMLIRLTIDVSELTYILTTPLPGEYSRTSWLNVRQLYTVVSKLDDIRGDLMRVSQNIESNGSSWLQKWYNTKSGAELGINSGVRAHVPTPIESEIMEHVSSYLSYNNKLVNEMTSTFEKVRKEFRYMSNSFIGSINFDTIILQIFTRFKNEHYNSIKDKTKTRVSKFSKEVKASPKVYQNYLFEYLEKLEDEGKGDVAKKCIYDAHIIGKPLCITDKEIKDYLLNKDSVVDEKRFRRLMEFIIAINYIKEKCGDITSDDIETDNGFEINKGTSGRKPEILFTDKAMKLWKKLQDAGYVDENFQPIKPKLSDNKATIVAAVIGDILHLSPMWVHFEKLWQMNDMSTKYSIAKMRKYYSGLHKEIINLLVI